MSAPEEYGERRQGERTPRRRHRSASWSNWSGRVHERSRLTASPSTETAVRALVQGAAGSRLTVKAVGAGHSFNDIAAAEGLRVDLDSYQGIVSVNEATDVVTFRAGTRLSRLPELLAPYGLALENQGDIDHQTLAGAISTGTHGTGLAFTGLSAMVASLRMVLADGSVLYCDARTHPEVFEFARLGLGALGIITEVGMRCVPAFRLEAHESAMPVTEVIDSFGEFARGSDHFEFFWFPHGESALVKRNRRLANDDIPADAPQPGTFSTFVDKEVVQNWAHAVAINVGRLVPAVIPSVNRLSASLMGGPKYSGPAHEVFVTPRRVRFNELEYAVPVADAPEVIREVRRVIERGDWRISFPIEVRTAAADDVPLSTAYGRESAYIAVHRFNREPHTAYFGAIEEVLQAAGGRPHWGKLHSMRAADFAEVYPRFGEFVGLRDRLDPGRIFGNHYLERVLGS